MDVRVKILNALSELKEFNVLYGGGELGTGKDGHKLTYEFAKYLSHSLLALKRRCTKFANDHDCEYIGIAEISDNRHHERASRRKVNGKWKPWETRE